jgi:hypothetical protein
MQSPEKKEMLELDWKWTARGSSGLGDHSISGRIQLTTFMVNMVVGIRARNFDGIIIDVTVCRTATSISLAFKHCTT